MKLKDIIDSKNELNVKMTDFENFFDIYTDKKLDVYYFNLNSTIYFKDIEYLTYDVLHDQYWTQLSYNIYKTTRLWWVLMRLNDVDVNHTFDVVQAGTTIKYLSLETISSILTQMEQ